MKQSFYKEMLQELIEEKVGIRLQMMYILQLLLIILIGIVWWFR